MIINQTSPLILLESQTLRIALITARAVHVSDNQPTLVPRSLLFMDCMTSKKLRKFFGFQMTILHKTALGAFLDRGNYEAQLLGVQDSSQANLFPGMMDGILVLFQLLL
jgi:hypothetical protein